MSQEAAAGRRLGHFRLLEQIGAGGMGEVYRAHDERLDRDVAIKILPPGSLSDDKKRKRFKQEALALAKLNHPNIAAIYDFDSEGDSEFLVMELLSGKSLADKLEAGPLPERMVVNFGRQMCEGLAAAHAQGILHRDLKPANLGLSADGRLKILDFGLAKLLYSNPGDATGSLTDAPVVGTLRYMAPEQLSGKNIDARADIYAAGMVLYEMSTGKRPFHDENGVALISSILNQPPIPPPKLNPQISAPLTAIILKALEKDPARRYSSAQELLSDLDRLGTADKTVAVQQASQSRRRRLLLALAGLAVVASIAALAWRFLHRGQIASGSGQRPLILVGDFENRTGEPVFDSSLREMFTASLEQSHWVQLFPNIRLTDVLRRMDQPANKTIDERTGLEISQRENLQGVLLGSIVRLGKKYVLLARIEAPSSAALASVEESADKEDEIPGRIDEIAETLRRKFGESQESVKNNSVPLDKVTSPSLEAIRYYTLGKQSFYKADLDQVVLMLTKAVELDPDFAIAHYLLSIAYSRLGDTARGREQIRLAVQLADHVSEPERLRIMGLHYTFLLDVQKLCETYRLLMQLEPEDPSPYINLGVCEADRFNPAAAVAYTEKALKYVPQSGVRINLASQLLEAGDLERAMQVALSFSQDFPGDLYAQSVLGRAYLALDRLEEARQVFKGMIRTGGGPQLEGDLYLADLEMATGQYRDAEAALKAAILAADEKKNRVAGLRARTALAELLLRKNAPASSIRNLLSHADLPADDPVLTFMLGKTYAEAGQLDFANKSWRALDLLIQKDDVPAMLAMRYRLRAEILLAQKKFDDAVKAAQSALQFRNSAFAIETLARCYAAAGKPDLAAQQYEAMLPRAPELLNTSRLSDFDAPVFRRAVEAHYQLGLLYQKLGQPDKARLHLQKFLDYWSHADGTISLDKEAQRLLRELGSNGTPTPAK